LELSDRSGQTAYVGRPAVAWPRQRARRGSVVERRDERIRRASAAQRLDHAGQIAARRDLRDQSLELALGPKARSRQQLCLVLLRQVGSDEQNTRQVDGGLGQHLEQDRKLPRQARGATTPLGLVLRHAQFVHAIGVQRGAGSLAMNAACLDFGEMREQVRKERVSAAGEAFDLTVQCGVRQLGEC
jgi:hypothetical protein